MQKLEIGQIVNTFGIKGMVKVVPYTDDIKRFDKLKNIYINTRIWNRGNKIPQKYGFIKIKRYR